MFERRQFLSLSAIALAAAALRGSPAAAAEERFGPAEPFDFEQLIARARALAAAPYQAPVVRHPEIMESIDYDAYQQIKIRPERALWADDDEAFAVQLFHLGRYFPLPVKIHVIEDGMAREVLYSTDYFQFGDTGLDEQLPGDIGFAGLRVMNTDNPDTDWLAIQGASYYRSSGELDQYGLSARAIAIDTAMPKPEEFPRFTEFWLRQGGKNSHEITLFALVDGPSVAGAYRLDCVKDGSVVVGVRAEIFARSDIARMGIAPLTSMFWFAENNRHQARDWRPEIHDSDGLAIWTGGGERLWRPLNNPAVVRTNSFIDDNPRGFGLLQRDRAFYNYEDDGVFYDRRPTVWIEPLGEWGRGAVQLVEIPTDDEIHDNIVAYWVPEQPVKAGSEWSFNYRVYWVDEEPFLSTLVGRVISTRLGKAGVPGQPRPEGGKKFVIDFAGGPLEELEKLDKVMPVITTSRGRIDNEYALQVVGTKHWRAFFDLYVEGEEPVDLRCFLQLGDETLTETWLYQYLPFTYG